tara:strand:+ start:5373 stop:6413 length:1041 start_codon:yes stop_codon:yes gene_type:complete
MFVEGDLADALELDRIDDSWTRLQGKLDAHNIREEGLDRRVIKSSTWNEPVEKGGPSYYYSSSQATLKFPFHDTYGIDGMAVFSPYTDDGVRPEHGAEIQFNKAVGGIDGLVPKIRCTWEVGKTAAIIVRCSFRLTWHCSAIATNDWTDYPGTPEGWVSYYGKAGEPPTPYPIRTIAASPINLWLKRKEFSKDVETGEIGTNPGGYRYPTIFHEEPKYKGDAEQVFPIASVRLARLFADFEGAKGYDDPVTGYDGDLRSNVNVPITLIDCIRPEDIWNEDPNAEKHFVDGNNSTIDFTWELRYNHWAVLHNFASIVDTPWNEWVNLMKDYPAELHDINFYAQKFNR